MSSPTKKDMNSLNPGIASNDTASVVPKFVSFAKYWTSSIFGFLDVSKEVM